MMKNLYYLSVICLILFIGSTYSVKAQRSSGKNTKIVMVQVPLVDVSQIKTYQFKIHHGSIPVTQEQLREKKGIGGKLQNLQDNVNNQDLPSYFSPVTIQENFSSSDITIELAYGAFEIVGKKINEHKIPCKREGDKLTKENILECPAYYYDVNYVLPVILRIKDRSGKVVYATSNMNPGTTTFGYDASGLTGYLKTTDLDAAYADPKAKESLAVKSLIERMMGFEEEVNESIYFREFVYNVEISTGAGSYDYSDLDAAQKKAIDALEGKTSAESLKECITTWENALKELDRADNKARISERVGMGLYENLTYAYMYLNEYEKSKQNIDQALELQRNVANKSGEENLKAVQKRVAKLLANKDVELANRNLLKNPRINVVSVYESARVKSKDAQGQYLFAGGNFAEFSSDLAAFEANRKASEPKPPTLEEALSAESSRGYANRAQQSVGGKILVLLPLYGDDFESLPLEITTISDLVQLNATNITNFKTIPAEIEKLTNMKRLLLYGNALTSLPEEIGNLTNLETLNLKDNKLTSLPASVSKLKNLKKLDLQGNNISTAEQAKIKAALPGCKIKF